MIGNRRISLYGLKNITDYRFFCINDGLDMFLVGDVRADGLFVKRNGIEDVSVRTDTGDCANIILMFFIIGAKQLFSLFV